MLDAPSENVRLKLINSTLYKRLKPFLVAAFFISYFLSWVYTLPMAFVLVLVALNLMVPLVLRVYSKNFKHAGYLSIDENHIVLAKKFGSPLIVPIAQMEDFKISRGATVHYPDEVYAPDTHDNWISFTYNKHLYKAEFCISNRQENESFEKMIGRLRRTHSNFYYETI